MKRKAVSGIMLTLLLVGMLTLAFNIQPAKASRTIYIRANGSVDPPTANITSSDNITYYFTDNNYDEIVVERDNIVVDGVGYTLQGAGVYPSKGIDLTGRSNVTIENIGIKAFYFGIYLYESPNNTISGNNITENNEIGIWLNSSSNYTSISGNTVTANNNYGILLGYSSNNMILENNVTLNHDGIHLLWSDDNVISGNLVSNNQEGISIRASSGNILRENNMTANSLNIGWVEGNSLLHFIQDIDTSNTVDGKPIYWLINECDKQIPTDAGFVGVVNSTNITVENLKLTNNYYGVSFAFTNNSRIQNVTVSNNEYGIALGWSSNNTICDNNVTSNFGRWGTGIGLRGSHNTLYNNTVISNSGTAIGFEGNYNVIRRNAVSNNTDGISFIGDDNIVDSNTVSNNNRYGVLLKDCSNNRIYGNNITNNNWKGVFLYSSSNYNNIFRNNITDSNVGVGLSESSNNTFHHNNFINNIQQVDIDSSGYANSWDHGYPSGGNYWSNYLGVDVKSGPYQNLTGGDGIGDTPYVIDGNNTDHYPLVSPYWYWSNPITGDLNKDMVVNMRDISLAARAFGSYPGHPRWNPIADITGPDGEPDNRVDMRDISLVARNFGETV